MEIILSIGHSEGKVNSNTTEGMKVGSFGVLTSDHNVTNLLITLLVNVIGLTERIKPRGGGSVILNIMIDRS